MKKQKRKLSDHAVSEESDEKLDADDIQKVKADCNTNKTNQRCHTFRGHSPLRVN